jgi:hypothetical protein
MSIQSLQKAKWLRLLICFGVVAFVWLVVFPNLRWVDAIAKHMDHMEKREVNAGAMYYTELEHLPLRAKWIEDEIQLWPE